MNYYEDLCRAECPEGCGRGIRVNRGIHEDFDLEKDGKTIRNYRAFPCTAPDRDTVIDRLAAELSALKQERDNDTERLDWVIWTLRQYGSDGARQRMFDRWGDWDRATIDAARAQGKDV